MANQLQAELEKRVQGRFQDLMDSRQRVLQKIPGILGRTNDTGSADVDGSPGWVYVRIGNDETIATAFNNRVASRNGLPVFVGYDSVQPNLFQVLSTREAYSSQGAAGGGLPNHHAQHEWGSTTGGDDLIWLRMRQVADFLVYPTNPASLSVSVGDGVYFLDGTAYKYAGGALDLTAHVPVTGMRWVTVALNASGPYAVAGTNSSSVTWSDIPDSTDSVDVKLAAVLLKAGDTAITDWPNDARIVDLRLASNRAATSTRIELHSTSVSYHAISDAGMAEAVAAASSGDAILVPATTLANDYTVPEGVSVVGASQKKTLFSGQVTLEGADSALKNVSVVRSKDDASDYVGVLGPSAGVGYVFDCMISVTQAGAGDGYGISVQGMGGTLHVYGGRVYGSTADTLR